MESKDSATPAIGHTGYTPVDNNQRSVPYLEVPSVTSPGWWSLLAGTGMPRRNSVGFTENYVSESAPPFCLDEDSNSSDKMTASSLCVTEANMLSPSTPVKRRPSTGGPNVQSPNDEFLTQYWSRHHGVDGSSNVSVVVTNYDDLNAEMDCTSAREDSLMPSTHFQSINVPITSKLTESIQMENFPVATSESLAELDKLKEEIMATDFDDTKTMTKNSVKTKKYSDGKDCDVQAHQDIENEKPPSKLVSLLLSQPFAQNWFFQKNDTEDEDAKKKSTRLKQMNMWAPQNL